MNNLDIVVQFAILWGERIGSAFDDEEEVLADKMKAYDSLEASKLFVAWAEEYMGSDIEDSVEFFESKLAALQ